MRWLLLISLAAASCRGPWNHANEESEQRWTAAIVDLQMRVSSLERERQRPRASIDELLKQAGYTDGGVDAK